MSRRTVALIASVVLAAVAAVALISYVRHVENQATVHRHPVLVLVAKDTIPQGTSAEDASSKGLFTQENIPQQFVPPNAVGDVAQIKGQVAQVTIVKGEQIVSSRWGQPGTVGTGLPIPNGNVAMSVQVDLVPGVAGFVQPGNLVSIIGHLDLQPLPGATGASARTIHKVQFILQAITVLAIGPRQVAVQGQPAQQQAANGAVIATLALTPSQAEKLDFFIKHGDIYFTLLPQGAKPTTTSGRTQDNAFS